MDAKLQRIVNPEAFGIFKKPNASVSIQGNLVEYKVHQKINTPVGCKRGTINDFSPGARLRMLKDFHRINFADHVEPLFMTLTYPDHLANPSHEQRNIHRKVMARHLEKETGEKVPAAWRIEWMPRKSGQIMGEVCPHWHWMIFRHRYISYDAVNRAWKKTIGADGYVRTEIKRVDRGKAILLYMAKYISKEAVPLSLVYDAKQNSLGRAYGWLRKGVIPMYPQNSFYPLPDDARATLMRLAEERLPWIAEGRERSFTLLGEVAADAEKILRGECLDGG